MALEPSFSQRVVESLSRSMERSAALNFPPIVMCSSQIRSHFKKMVDRFMPNVTVLSYDEILNNVEIQPIGTVELSDAD
jgi:flagellar biosynthesis protein FlhA